MKQDKNIPYKVYLSEDELPKAWYNVRADMKNKPAPLLNPGTGKPLKAEELAPIFCDELIKQELDDDTAYIEIPQEIRDCYKMFRPSPLVRAYFLEAGLLRQEAGSERRYHRNRRRSVGYRSFDGVFLLRSGLQGLHGQGFL